MRPTDPPSGLISEALIRRFFSGSESEHRLLVANLGKAHNYRGASGWPMEQVSLELAAIRGERGRDDWP
jgi:hypothetical protein